MSIPALAAVFLGLAAACYILGLWVGRRTCVHGSRHRKSDGPTIDEYNDLFDAFTNARKYRLAWLSARRRAHRGRLLAQLLREDEQ